MLGQEELRNYLSGSLPLKLRGNETHRSDLFKITYLANSQVRIPKSVFSDYSSEDILHLNFSKTEVMFAIYHF